MYYCKKLIHECGWEGKQPAKDWYLPEYGEFRYVCPSCGGSVVFIEEDKE